LSEAEVNVFVNSLVNAAGKHQAKLIVLLETAKPYILRDREFYNKQGMRNATGKTWTQRKQELANIYGVGLRTFERGFSTIFEKLVTYTFTIPGLVDQLEVKVPRTFLPQVELIADRARASGEEKQPPQGDEPTDVSSPSELWQIIDNKLTDAIDDVFHVAEPQEFAARLQLFAKAVADKFFPGTLVDVQPAPEDDAQEGEAH
jgi:hypothetical protein